MSSIYFRVECQLISCRFRTWCLQYAYHHGTASIKRWKVERLTSNPNHQSPKFHNRETNILLHVFYISLICKSCGVFELHLRGWVFCKLYVSLLFNLLATTAITTGGKQPKAKLAKFRRKHKARMRMRVEVHHSLVASIPCILVYKQNSSMKCY